MSDVSFHELFPLGAAPVRHYIARYHCSTLVMRGGGVEHCDSADVGIHFSDHYLRVVVPGEVVTLLAPLDLWHPNAMPPLLCIGRVEAGTQLGERGHARVERVQARDLSSQCLLLP